MNAAAGECDVNRRVREGRRDDFIMVGADGVSRRSCGAMWGGRERNGQE
jgi:hypothetical protein